MEMQTAEDPVIAIRSLTAFIYANPHTLIISYCFNAWCESHRIEGSP